MGCDQPPHTPAAYQIFDRDDEESKLCRRQHQSNSIAVSVIIMVGDLYCVFATAGPPAQDFTHIISFNPLNGLREYIITVTLLNVEVYV